MMLLKWKTPMDKALKQRLVGASVLIILAVIILPMLLGGRSDTLKTESRQIELPPQPEELSFETRRFPIGVAERPAVTPRQQATEPENQESVPADTGSGAEPLAVAEAAQPVAKPPEVKTVIIHPAENTRPAPAATETSEPERPRYLVQVASFSSEKRANAMADELRAAKLPVMMDVVDRTAGRLHRVRVGPYVGRAEADEVVVRVRDMNRDLRPRIVDTRPGDGAPVSTPSDPLVRWVVQVGSYTNAATAESEVAKLRLLGLHAFTEKVSAANGFSYKVRIGPEIERANAVQLAKDIKAQHHLDGFVTTQD